jgi:Tfp pilus assembly protein PilV
MEHGTSNMKHKTYYNKNKLGFSIIEVIAAFTIITIGLVGVLALVNQNIQAQQINRNMLIASQLAQEGLELVRNKRDANWLIDGNDWKIGAGAGTDSDIVQDLTYTIDYSGNINGSVNDISSANLKINASGFYEHASGDSTIFYRLITVADNGDWVEVNSRVQWKERGGTKDYTASTVLYDWR